MARRSEPSAPAEEQRLLASGYLWTIPQHREVWKRLAAENGGRGLYLSFCDVVANDSQYLLDDVIKTLPEVGVHALPPPTPSPLNLSTAYWDDT